MCIGGLAPDSATEDWWIPVLSVLLFLVFLVLITIVLSLLYTHQKVSEYDVSKRLHGGV